MALRKRTEKELKEYMEAWAEYALQVKIYVMGLEQMIKNPSSNPPTKPPKPPRF